MQAMANAKKVWYGSIPSTHSGGTISIDCGFMPTYLVMGGGTAATSSYTVRTFLMSVVYDGSTISGISCTRNTNGRMEGANPVPTITIAESSTGCIITWSYSTYNRSQLDLTCLAIQE